MEIHSRIWRNVYYLSMLVVVDYMIIKESKDNGLNWLITFQCIYENHLLISQR